MLVPEADQKEIHQDKGCGVQRFPELASLELREHPYSSRRAAKPSREHRPLIFIGCCEPGKLKITRSQKRAGFRASGRPLRKDHTQNRQTVSVLTTWSLLL